MKQLNIPMLAMLDAAPEIRLPPPPAVVPVIKWSRPSCWSATGPTVVAARRQVFRNLDQFVELAGLLNSRLPAPAGFCASGTVSP